jgi:hypothetical protein
MPTWDAGGPLRAWLRKTFASFPNECAHVRIRTPEGEERYVDIPKDHRNKFVNLEEAILAQRAESVEILDGKKKVLRAKRLEPDGEGELVGSYAAKTNIADADSARERHATAAMLREYGHALNTAFDRGAQAAGVSQEHLVNLVEHMTQQFTIAITNLHNVSVNLAHQIQASGKDAPEEPSDHDKNTQLLGQVVQLAIAKMAGGGANNVKKDEES